tara:strand:+ start:32 stop:574 length:543 start_codon:yes stop_codon:yes gene_type:complete
MEFKEIKKIFEKFGDKVVANAKNNLSKKIKNSSGNLAKSIDYKIKQNNQSITLSFIMEDYGDFQDKGVKGAYSTYPGILKNNKNTFYKYRKSTNPFSKGAKVVPPSSAFDKWGVRQGLAPRTKGGQFKSRTALNFALARSVYEKGIKPKYFFTNAFNRAFNQLPKDLEFALIIEITDNIE